MVQIWVSRSALCLKSLCLSVYVCVHKYVYTYLYNYIYIHSCTQCNHARDTYRIVQKNILKLYQYHINHMDADPLPRNMGLLHIFHADAMERQDLPLLRRPNLFKVLQQFVIRRGVAITHQWDRQDLILVGCHNLTSTPHPKGAVLEIPLPSKQKKRVPSGGCVGGSKFSTGQQRVKHGVIISRPSKGHVTSPRKNKKALHVG